MDDELDLNSIVSIFAQEINIDYGDIFGAWWW